MPQSSLRWDLDFPLLKHKFDLGGRPKKITDFFFYFQGGNDQDTMEHLTIFAHWNQRLPLHQTTHSIWQPFRSCDG